MSQVLDQRKLPWRNSFQRIDCENEWWKTKADPFRLATIAHHPPHKKQTSVLLTMTLLFDAFSAYLGPLLAKDREGKYIQWEDLVASHSASSEVLKAEENNSASVRDGATKLLPFD